LFKRLPKSLELTEAGFAYLLAMQEAMSASWRRPIVRRTTAKAA